MISKYLYIPLLLSVFFSSTGFVLGKHHCQRMEQSKGKEITSCSDLGGCKEGCCSTDFQYFHLDQDQQTAQTNLYLPGLPSVSIVSLWLLPNLAIDSNYLPCRLYRPPIVVRNIPVIFQVFRC